MSNVNRRGPWSPEEDQKLMELITVFGPTNWVRISNSLVTRSPKQCRERYHQNLKPSLNRTPITPEEGELIEQLVSKYGKKWAEIARHLNGRSDNAIKNWWNGGASKRRRASVQHDKLNSQEYQGPKDQMFPPNAPQISRIGGPPPSQMGQVPVPGHIGQVPGHLTQIPQPLTHMGQMYPHQMVQPNMIQVPPNSGTPTHQLAPGIPSPFSNSNQNHNYNGMAGPNPSNTLQPAFGREEVQKISFNTSMFSDADKTNKTNDSESPTKNERAPPALNLPGSSRSASRSASFDHSNNQLPPLLNKRRLFEDLPSRRHSTTTTNIYSLPNIGSNSTSSLTNSHPNLNSTLSNGQQSPYNQSPLLLSSVNSRNNSISTTFDINLTHSDNNSSSNSRRSSIAPDFFPNPLKEVNHKRNVSTSSNQKYLPQPLNLNQQSPSSINNSPTSLSFALQKNSNLSSVLNAKDKSDTKIRVSSLID